MAIRKTFLLFLANTFGSGLGLLVTYLIAHLMGAAALGTIGYIMGLTGVVAFVSNAGYAQAHFRYAAGRQDIGDCVSTYGVIIGVLTVMQLLVLAALPVMSQWLGQPVLHTSEEWSMYLAFSGGLLLTSGTRLFSVTYYAQEATAKVSLALALGSLAVALAQIGVALAGLGIVMLGIAYQIEPAVKLLVLWLTSNGVPFGRPRRSIAIQYSRYTAPIAVREALASLSANVDKIQLQHLAGPQHVGFYIGNLGTAAAMNRITVAAMRLFFPRTVADIEQGNFASVRRRLRTVLRYLLLVVVPLFALVMAYSQPLVRLTLGADFLPSVATLRVLALQAIGQTILLVYTNVILALGKHGSLVPINVLSLGVLVLGNMVLIPNELFGLPMAGLGSTGAAVALTAATFSALGLQVAVTSRLAGIGFPPALLWFVVGGGSMAGILHAPAVLGFSLALWQFPLLWLFSLGVFVGVMLFTRQISVSELRLLCQALRPIHMFRYIQAELSEECSPAARPSREHEEQSPPSQGV